MANRYKLEEVGGRYGAPMGRPGAHPGDDPHCRLYVGRVRLDRGGYDSGGAYWGLGEPLWYIQGFDEFEGMKTAIEDFARFQTKAEAIAFWRKQWPNARIS